MLIYNTCPEVARNVTLGARKSVGINGPKKACKNPKDIFHKSVHSRRKVFEQTRKMQKGDDEFGSSCFWTESMIEGSIILSGIVSGRDGAVAFDVSQSAPAPFNVEVLAAFALAAWWSEH